MPSSRKRRLKVVLDTNIWVSAMIWGGMPARIIKTAEENKIAIITSEEILQEISRTLAYPRLREIYEGTGVSREQLIEAILRVATLVEVKTRVRIIQDDLTDDKFLGCALDGKADFVVSGDEHLLRKEHHQGIHIVSARQFLKLLEENKGQSVSEGNPNLQE